MYKQVARVDLLLDNAVGHIAAVSGILCELNGGDLQPNAAQCGDIATLRAAITACSELTKRRNALLKPSSLKSSIKSLSKHAKLTPNEILDYAAELKLRRVLEPASINAPINATTNAPIRAKL